MLVHQMLEKTVYEIYCIYDNNKHHANRIQRRFCPSLAWCWRTSKRFRDLGTNGRAPNSCYRCVLWSRQRGCGARRAIYHCISIWLHRLSQTWIGCRKLHAEKQQLAARCVIVECIIEISSYKKPTDAWLLKFCAESYTNLRRAADWKSNLR